MNNTDIKTAIKEVQEKCLEHDQQLADMFVPVILTHVTVLVLYAEQENIEAVKDIIADAIKNNDINLFDVKFEGLGSFNKNQILFAKPAEGGDNLKHLNNVCYTALTNRGFICNDKSYNPHLTIMKKGETVKSVPDEAFAGEEEKYFGVERVSEIQLCLMGEERDGYYNIVGQWGLS